MAPSEPPVDQRETESLTQSTYIMHTGVLRKYVLYCMHITFEHVLEYGYIFSMKIEDC